MSENVQVTGMPNTGVGGLKESLSRFQKHHKEVGDALLNISGIGTVTGGAVDQEDPRLPYEHQDWPKLVYHATGDQETVQNAAELKDAMERGFRIQPYLRPQVAVLDPATEKKALMDQTKQQQAIIAQQNELLAQLAERVQAIEKTATKTK